MENYDVIIAGAGPAGSNCARELSKLGHNILVIESSKKIGVPNFSTGGTPNETLEVFRLPKKVADKSWSSILVASLKERVEFDFGRTMGYVLNYKLLNRFLIEEARKDGAEIKTEVSAQDVILKNNRVIGVKIKEDGEMKDVFAKIVIDATGSRSTLAKKIGLIKRSNRMIVGIEYLMENVELEKPKRLDFYVGRTIAPGGYAWLFPSGSSSAKVGVGILQNQNNSKKPIELLKDFVKWNDQTKNSKIKDIHGGSLYANGGIDNHATDGFIVIGDAACQINPLGGEGIRHALYSGKFAAETVNEAINGDDISRKILNSYNVRWKKYIGRKWKISLILQKIFCRLNDEKINALIRVASKFGKEDVFDVVFNYNFGKAKKYLPLFIKHMPKEFIKSLGL